MFFDRLGNSVTGEPKIVEEPIVESYYDPHRPVRPGFEKPEMFQEGLFDIFKKDPPFESFEEMEEYTGSKIDPSFKKFNQSHNKGDIINYPVSKIDDDYCRNMIEEYYGDTVPFKMFGQQYILKNEGRYRDIIDTNDYCIAFAEIGPDPDGNLDPLCLWIATEKTKTWNAGTILLSEVINSDYPDDSNVFTKSFKEFSKNVTSGKSIKEYSEMDLDEMSDYIQENVIMEANEASKKARKNAQEFMRREYGTAHPTSMTSKQRNRMKRWLKDNDYDPKTETIATDMKSGDGKAIRVNLGTNSAAGKGVGQKSNMPFYATANPFYPEEKYTPVEQHAFVGGRPLINMPKEYMKRHPSVSTGISKHEEGHLADYYGKIDDVVDRRIEAGEHITQSMKKGMDYSPTHTDVKEHIADLYSVQHNKYKDKLRFLNAFLSEDIHMQRKFKANWKDLCKNIYKKQSDDQPPIIDASSVETMRDSIKNMVSRTKANIKSYKAQLKTPLYQSGKNLLNRLIASGKDACDEYEKILRKWFIGKLLFKKVDYDDAKVIVDKAVWHDAKLAVDEAIRQSDGDIEIRREFLKKYINEFAIEYDMSTIDVIQEMYLQDMEDYVFQEDYEEDEFVSREIILEEKISAAERNELDDDDFGLVYTDEDGKKVRKYPLTDENHIRQAVRFFSHCPDEHKPQLARKILKKANEHDMDTSNWGTIHEWAKK